MRTNFSQAIRIFFSPETLAPFLIGSVFLAILGNAIYDILKNAIGTETPALIKIALSALLIFSLSVLLLARIIQQRLNHLNRDKLNIGKRSPKKHPGLILLVSHIEPCRQAIRYHQPNLQHCWLICSLQTLDTARKIAQEFPTLCNEDPVIINDVYDPIEFRDLINEIYTDRLPPGWTETDLIADYAGMTAHGSVGMILSAIGHTRALQYTPANLDRTTGRILGSLDPIEITLTWETADPIDIPNVPSGNRLRKP